MDDAALDMAEEDAKRFLDRLAAYRVAIKRDNYPVPRESGSLRRSSMDLTRSLSAMRKPQRYG